MIDFCICNAIDLLLSPTSCLSAWLTSGEYTQMTYVVMLYILCQATARLSLLQFPTEWHVFGCPLYCFRLSVFRPRLGQLISITDTVLHSIGTLRSTTATSKKTPPRNITLLYHNFSAVILSRSRLTIWAKYPYNKLVRAVTK